MITESEIERRFRAEATKHGITDEHLQNALLFTCHTLLSLAGDVLQDTMPREYLERIQRPTAIASLMTQAAHLAADVMHFQAENGGVPMNVMTVVRGDLIRPGTTLHALMQTVASRRKGMLVANVTPPLVKPN